MRDGPNQSDQAPPTAQFRDAQIIDQMGTVVVDVECGKCRYNLRGLSETGLCPECGAPIGPSIEAHLLSPPPASMKSFLTCAVIGVGSLGLAFALVPSTSFVQPESLCFCAFLGILLLLVAWFGSVNALLNRQSLHHRLAVLTFVISTLCLLCAIGVLILLGQ